MSDKLPYASDADAAPTVVEPLGPPPRRWNWRVMIVLFLIVLPVLFGIYFAWQAYSPPDPAGMAVWHMAVHTTALLVA